MNKRTREHPKPDNPNTDTRTTEHPDSYRENKRTLEHPDSYRENVEPACPAGRLRSIRWVIHYPVFVILNSLVLPIAIGMFFCSVGLSQSSKIDSLQALLQTNIHDTTRINTLNRLGWALRHQIPDTAIVLGKKALELAVKNGDSKGQGNSNSVLGVYYWLKRDYPLSLSHHFKALEARKQRNDKKGVSVSVGNIGLVYHNQGDYPKALEYYFKALKMREELGAKNLIATVLGNIGVVYMDQGDYPKATEYYFKALKMAEEIGDKNRIAIWLGNIGSVYRNQGDSTVAAGDTALAMADKYPKALEYYFRALKMSEELGNKSHIASWLGNIGSLYTRTGRFAEAEVYLDSALALCESIGALNYTMQVEKSISSLYDTTGRYQLALEHYKKYSAAKDSLFNEEKSKDLGKLEAKHEFETAEAERKRIEEEQAKQAAAEKSRRDNLQYSGILIFLVILGAGLLALGKLNIPVRLAEGMIFFAFLLFFEFTLVLLDPFIEQYSSGAPAIKLAFNAVLAGLIFPLHSFFEAKLKKNLVKRQ